MQAIFYNNLDTDYIPHILQEIYIEKVYQRFLSDLDKEISTVADIGLNVGVFSQYISQFAKRVIGLEPAKSHAEIAKKMLEFNKINNVEVIQKALSNENGKAVFNHSQNTTMYSLESAVNNTGKTEEVETITMKRLFEDYKIDKIDLMKLDVEGSEFKVLASKEFKEMAPRIKNVIVEIHSWNNTRPDHAVAMLHDYGYKVERIPAQASLLSARR